MKFLYVGDIHESPDAPRARIDNWNETRNEKTHEIRELAKKYKVKAILQGGDFLSSPKYGLNFIIDILNRWGYKVHNEVLLEEGAIQNVSKEPPLVGPIGNHELFGMSHKSYEKTSLFFLERNGFITMPTKENPLIFTDEEGFTVAVTCGHFEEGMDDTKEPYIVEEKQGDYHIHIVHGMLTKGKYFEDAPHTTIDEISHTKADLTIGAHDHVGFNLIEVDGKYFVNPGAPFRLSAREIKRKPKVLLIDINKEQLKVRNIYLKSAKEGVEVLNPDIEEFKRERKNVLEEARERTKSNDTFGDITEIVNTIALDDNIEEEIKNNALQRITDKIDNSKAKSIEGDNNLNQPYYISKMILENFGSHEYSKFDFSPKMNIFIGATSSGKTTILRAFRWLYDDYGNSKRFIKKGSDEARVTIYTSHGYIITRFCHRKKASKNGFEIIYPDGHSEVLNTKGLKVVQDILAYSKLDLESKKVDLNFLSQGSSWFFIGEDYSSGDRAKIIGSIYKTHLVDLAIKDLESESRKLSQQKEVKTKTLNELENKIKEFDYLDVMEENIEKLEKLKVQLMERVAKKNRIKELNKEMISIEEEIKRCETILESINLENLEKNKILLERLDLIYLKTLKLSPMVKELSDTKNQINILEKALSTISNNDIVSLKNSFTEITDKYNRFIKIKKLNDSLLEIEKEIEQYNEVLKHIDMNKLATNKNALLLLEAKYLKMQNLNNLSNKMKDILADVNKIKAAQEKLKISQELKNKLEETENKIGTLIKIKELLVQRQGVIRDGSDARKELELNQKRLQNAVVIYKALLTKNKKCPICNSVITEAIADKITNDMIQCNH